MRTASPWWASLVFGLGLIFLFIGERLLGDIDAARVFFTGILGLVPMVAVTALRAWTTLRTTGDRRRIERTLLLCHAGTLLALVLYALTTKWGITTLKIENVARWQGALTVLYAVLLVVSLVPVLLIEVSLGSAMREGIDFSDGGGDAGVDYVRVRDVSWSGLSIAFAVSFLFVTCQVAKERNVSRDVSYFKTSAPGESTRNMVSASTEPIKIHLFFPETNEVKEQVLTYFEALKSATGKVEIETHDRLADTAATTKYKIGKDGVIVIARGEGDKEKNYTIELETDIDKVRRGSGPAAGKLRNLDREVNSILTKVMREKRKAYLTAGHGEATHFSSVPPEMRGKIFERRTSLFKRRLGDLNYEIKDLSPMDLMNEVPDDATLVVIFGPSVPLQTAEWEALGRYLDKGGHVLIALNPEGAPSMGPLENRFGLKMAPGNLTDDRSHARLRGTLPDRRLVVTSQFSAHASTTALSRDSRNNLFVVLDGGALEEIPILAKGETPKRTMTIQSMDTAWLDLNDNFAFDGDKEKRQKWGIGAAIEGPKVGDKDGFRALVFSDADLFVDFPGGVDAAGRPFPILLSGPLLEDAVRWLGGEEKFVGEVVSEDDKPVQHTKNQDAVWFTITVIGVPLLVLGLGLFGTLSRRKKKQTTEHAQEEEVTP